MYRCGTGLQPIPRRPAPPPCPSHQNRRNASSGPGTGPPSVTRTQTAQAAPGRTCGRRAGATDSNRARQPRGAPDSIPSCRDGGAAEESEGVWEVGAEASGSRRGCRSRKIPRSRFTRWGVGVTYVPTFLGCFACWGLRPGRGPRRFCRDALSHPHLVTDFFRHDAWLGWVGADRYLGTGEEGTKRKCLKASAARHYEREVFRLAER